MSADSRLLLPLREAVNVADLKQRDTLVRRLKKLRADVVLAKNTAEHRNRLHPTERPFDTSFEDAMIAWCDGTGPMPSVSEETP